MKVLSKLAIASALILGLVGCGKNNPSEPIDQSEEPSIVEPSEVEPPHEHVFGEWTEVTPATCTEAGKEERVCECGEKEERDIEALGHLPGEWEVAIEPTVEAEGQKVKKCQRCQEVLETEVIDKLEPPTPVIDPIELTAANLMGYAGTNMSYGDGSGTVGGVKFNFIECGAYGNGIQMRTKNGKSSTISNEGELPGVVKQIKIKLNNDKQVYANEHALTFSFGATSACADKSITWDTVADQKDYSIDVNCEGAVYFKLVHSITYSLYVDSIELVF